MQPTPTDAPLVVGFDLDMTLIDTVVGFARDAATRSAPSSGVEFPIEEMTSKLGPPLELMLEPHLPAEEHRPGGRPVPRDLPRPRRRADAGVPGRGRGPGRRTPPPRADRAGHRQVHPQRPAARRPPRPRRRRRRGRVWGIGKGDVLRGTRRDRSTSATTSTTSRARGRPGSLSVSRADRRLHPRGAGARPAPTSCSTDLAEFPAWLDEHLLDDPARARSSSDLRRPRLR